MKTWFDPHRLTGMAAPLAVWALHFVVVYSLQGLACARGTGQGLAWGLPGVTWALIGLSLLALAVIAWLGWRAWRSLAAPPPGQNQRAASFVCRLTLLGAMLGFIAVIFTVLPVLLLAPCE